MANARSAAGNAVLVYQGLLVRLDVQAQTRTTNLPQPGHKVVFDTAMFRLRRQVDNMPQRDEARTMIWISPFGPMTTSPKERNAQDALGTSLAPASNIRAPSDATLLVSLKSPPWTRRLWTLGTARRIPRLTPDAKK